MTGLAAAEERLPLPPELQASGLVAVVRAPSLGRSAEAIDALLAGGIRSIELTLTTPGLLEGFAHLAGRYGDAVELGIGTVTRADQVHRAVASGARFVVTPTTDEAVAEAARAGEVPIIMGGLTPTELARGWDAGAAAVKLFPAASVGPAYLSHLFGPFPQLEVVPSGGIAPEEIGAWLGAGACALSLGGPLVGDLNAAVDEGAIAVRAGRCLAAVAAARAAR